MDDEFLWKNRVVCADRRLRLGNEQRLGFDIVYAELGAQFDVSYHKALQIPFGPGEQDSIIAGGDFVEVDRQKRSVSIELANGPEFLAIIRNLERASAHFMRRQAGQCELEPARAEWLREFELHKLRLGRLWPGKDHGRF